MRIAKGGTPLPHLKCEPKASTNKLTTEAQIFPQLTLWVM